MPDIKLEKVSNSLRRSRNIIENKRNIIEELVKETRNLLSEQTEKSKDINNTKRPRSKIPRSPTVITLVNFCFLAANLFLSV